MQVFDREVIDTEARPAPRVVVVDDNEMFRSGLVDLLHDYDIPVLGEGQNGREAIALVEELQPDILILDLKMPDMDGLQAAKVIKERFPHVHVVMLTAYDDPAFRRDVGEAAEAYLIKGSKPESIREALYTAWSPKESAGEDEEHQDEPEDPLQRLTAAQMRIHLLRRQAESPQQLAALDELGHAVEIGIEGLRDLMFEVRPPEMSGERKDVVASIRALLTRRQMAADFNFEIDDRTTGQFSGDVADAILTVAREAIDNSVRHAEATSIEVVAMEQDGGLQVEITDDGIGLSPRSIHAEGGGLTIMRTVAEKAGGWCRLWSLPGAGTTIKVWVPEP